MKQSFRSGSEFHVPVRPDIAIRVKQTLQETDEDFSRTRQHSRRHDLVSGRCCLRSESNHHLSTILAETNHGSLFAILSQGRGITEMFEAYALQFPRHFSLTTGDIECRMIQRAFKMTIAYENAHQISSIRIHGNGH